MTAHQDASLHARRPWSPQHFGPLPGMETEVATGETVLFPGDRAALGARLLRQRIKLTDLIAARLDGLLEEGETVVWTAPVIEVPPLMHQLGLGYLWFYYYQTALVITDRRLLEVELGFRGRGVGTRTRSFPFSRLRSLKLSWRALVAQPSQGRRVAWKLRRRRDRRFLRPLIGAVAATLPGAKPQPFAASPGAAALASLPPTDQQPAEPGPAPLWHCPNCGAASDQHPTRCNGCAAVFRTPAMATWLALAFPGAGLFYTGHPILGLFDLLGELGIFGLLAFSILVSAPEELPIVLPLFLFLVFLTKVESVHLSRIFVYRTLPVKQGTSGTWRGLAMVGAILTALLVLGPVPFAGKLVERVDRDLTIEAEGWQVERDPAEWIASEPNQRSEWWGPEQIVVTANAYPLGAQTFQSWVDDLARAVDDTALRLPPGPVSGARLASRLADDEGNEWIRLLFLVHDEVNDDGHLLYLDCPPDASPVCEDTMLDLLAGASWIPAQP